MFQIQIEYVSFFVTAAKDFTAPVCLFVVCCSAGLN